MFAYESQNLRAIMEDIKISRQQLTAKYHSLDFEFKSISYEKRYDVSKITKQGNTENKKIVRHL